MKLAVAAAVAIALCLGSLTVRALVFSARRAPAAAVPAARAAPRAVDKRALAAIDQRLHRKLRRLARASEK
jgi:hypothetical protein